MLALDGIDYRDIEAAKQRGLFAEFRAPSRLISTFPSISDVAWHEIMGVQPPLGYQRVYYSTRLNMMVGDALDAIKPIEYEHRMDLAFDTKLHHLGAYLISNRVARGEVDTDAREFFRRGGRPTVYAYNVGPDAMQHTRGDLDRYLAHLDRRLTEMQNSYLNRTGQPLEIVILSDHGHNRAVTAEFLPVAAALEKAGFRTSRSISSPTDIAFSVDGVTTGFGVFCVSDSVARVASVLAGLDGVAVVTYRDGADRIVVRADTLSAEIEWKGAGATTRYRYQPRSGDPLRYATVLARMRQEGRLDSDGYASARDWVEYTAMEHFPAAPPRIVRGHTTVTLNPAPILVSLDDKVRVGLGAVSVANKMRPLGGTHGALSATNSLGVVMSNFVDTHDDLTATVREQFGGFNDLLNPSTMRSEVKVTTAGLLRADRWSGFHGSALPSQLEVAPDSAAVVVLAMSDADQRRRAGQPRLRVELRQTTTLAMRVTRGDSAIVSSFLITDWASSADGRTLALPMELLGAKLTRSAIYSVRVLFENRATADDATSRMSTRLIATTVMRTDARGAFAPY